MQSLKDVDLISTFDSVEICMWLCFLLYTYMQNKWIVLMNEKGVWCTICFSFVVQDICERLWRKQLLNYCPPKTRKTKVIKTVVQMKLLAVINVNTVNMWQPRSGFWTSIFHLCMTKYAVVQSFFQSAIQMMFLKTRIDK